MHIESASRRRAIKAHKKADRDLRASWGEIFCLGQTLDDSKIQRRFMEMLVRLCGTTDVLSLFFISFFFVFFFRFFFFFAPRTVDVVGH